MSAFTWTDEDRLESRKRFMSPGALRDLLAVESWVHRENGRRAQADFERATKGGK